MLDDDGATGGVGATLVGLSKERPSPTSAVNCFIKSLARSSLVGKRFVNDALVGMGGGVGIADDVDVGA